MQTTCESAYIDQYKFNQIFSEHPLLNLDERINFLQKFKFFSKWTIRELTIILLSFHVRSFVYNTIIHPQKAGNQRQLYFIYSGTIELISYKQQTNNNHPFQTKSKHKQKYTLCTLGAGEIFGEDSLIDENNEISFQVHKTSPQQQIHQQEKINSRRNSIQSTKTLDNKSNGIETQKKYNPKYTAICLEKCILLIINIDDIESQFNDNFTRYQFRKQIIQIWESRKQNGLSIAEKHNSSVDLNDNKIDELIQLSKNLQYFMEKEVKKSQPNIFQGTNTDENNENLIMTQQFKVFDDKFNKSEILMDLNNEKSIEKQNDNGKNNSQLNKRSIVCQNFIVNSKVPVIEDYDFFRKIKDKISSNQMYKLKQKNKSEDQSKISKKNDYEYQNLQKEEYQAMEQFKSVFLKMNKSYYKVKNFYHQKKLNDDNLFFSVFLNNRKQQRNYSPKKLESYQKKNANLKLTKNHIHNNMKQQQKNQTNFEKLIENDTQNQSFKDLKYIDKNQYGQYDNCINTPTNEIKFRQRIQSINPSTTNFANQRNIHNATINKSLQKDNGFVFTPKTDIYTPIQGRNSVSDISKIIFQKVEYSFN